MARVHRSEQGPLTLQQIRTIMMLFLVPANNAIINIDDIMDILKDIIKFF